MRHLLWLLLAPVSFGCEGLWTSDVSDSDFRSLVELNERDEDFDAERISHLIRVAMEHSTTFEVFKKDDLVVGFYSLKADDDDPDLLTLTDLAISTEIGYASRKAFVQEVKAKLRFALLTHQKSTIIATCEADHERCQQELVEVGFELLLAMKGSKGQKIRLFGFSG